MILYSKFSNERKENLCIRTDIVEENKVRFVRKSPANEAAKAHIANIFKAQGLLKALYQKQGAAFLPNSGVMNGEAIDFAYLSGESLTKKLDSDLICQPEAAEERLDLYQKQLDELADCEFAETEAFREVFGEAPQWMTGLPASSVSNIDMIPDNILIGEDGSQSVIDYEWTFDFAVPLCFIRWRMLHYYIQADIKRQWLNDRKYMEKSGFTAAQIEDFLKMEACFQEYVSGNSTPLRTLYPQMAPQAVSIGEILEHERNRDTGFWNLKFDNGEGFREKTMQVFSYEDGVHGDRTIHIDRSVKAVRIELGTVPCVFKIEEISTSMGLIFADDVKSNGRVIAPNMILFSTHQPWIEIRGWKSGATWMKLAFERWRVDSDVMGTVLNSMLTADHKVARLEGERQRLEDLVAQRTDITGSFMKTKGLKSYRFLRRKSRKSDPYQLLYPELQNDINQTFLQVDRVIYKKDECFIEGWTADKDLYRNTVTVVDEVWNVIDAQIFRLKRGDVAGELSLNPELSYGFAIHLPYQNIPSDGKVFVRTENARGFLRSPLQLETDEKKRRIMIQEDVDTDYDSWFRWHKPDEAELARQRQDHFAQNIKFSIVIPLYKTPEHFLRELVDSVIAQTYANWELVLSDASGEPSVIEPLLCELEQKDSRIKIVRNHRQLFISDNTNEAIKAATGDFIAFCDHDDLLAPDALYENAKAIREKPDTEVLYSDEDKINDLHQYLEPHFKPDFNFDLLNSQNYICHFFVAKRNIIEKVGLLNGEFDGSQDHDFILRCTEATSHIVHIPKILYHWRLSEGSTAQNPFSKMYCYENGRRAVQAHWDRLQIPASVEREPNLGYYRTYYHWDEQPLVSIIIPNKDHYSDLKRCIDSIVRKNRYQNYEIIVVENNSTQDDIFAYYKSLQQEMPDRVRVVTYQGTFNYSAINNFGVSFAKGDYLLFLNNDTEMIQEDCLEELLYPCMREDVGAVGAKLYYGNDTVQHAGVIVGYGGVAGHRFLGYGKNEVGYMFRITVAQDLSAVTAAAMMVKRSVFSKIEGFYEGLAVAYNDVDLCMKIGDAGFRIIYNPHAELYHYESQSRGYEDTPEKMARLQKESDLFASRWPNILRDGDPNYNPNCSAFGVAYSLKKMSEYKND